MTIDSATRHPFFPPPFSEDDMQPEKRDRECQGNLPTCAPHAFVNFLANSLSRKYNLSIKKEIEVYKSEHYMFESEEFDGIHIEQLANRGVLRLLDKNEERFLTVQVKCPLEDEPCDRIRSFERLHALVTTGFFCPTIVKVWGEHEVPMYAHAVCSFTPMNAYGQKMLLAYNSWGPQPTLAVSEYNYLSHCEMDVELISVQNIADGRYLPTFKIQDTYKTIIDLWRQTSLNYSKFSKLRLPEELDWRVEVQERDALQVHEAIAGLSQKHFVTFAPLRTKLEEQRKELDKIKKELKVAIDSGIRSPFSSQHSSERGMQLENEDRVERGMQLEDEDRVLDEVQRQKHVVLAFMNFLATSLKVKHGISVNRMEAKRLRCLVLEANRFNGLCVEHLCGEHRLRDSNNEMYLTVQIQRPGQDLVQDFGEGTPKPCLRSRCFERVYALVQTGLPCCVSVKVIDSENEKDIYRKHEVCAIRCLENETGKMLLAYDSRKEGSNMWVTENNYLSHCEMDIRLIRVRRIKGGTDLPRGTDLPHFQTQIEYKKAIDNWMKHKYYASQFEFPEPYIAPLPLQQVSKRENELEMRVKELENGLDQAWEAIRDFSKEEEEQRKIVIDFYVQLDKQGEELRKIKEQLGLEQNTANGIDLELRQVDPNNPEIEIGSKALTLDGLQDEPSGRERVGKLEEGVRQAHDALYMLRKERDTTNKEFRAELEKYREELARLS